MVDKALKQVIIGSKIAYDCESIVTMRSGEEPNRNMVLYQPNVQLSRRPKNWNRDISLLRILGTHGLLFCTNFGMSRDLLYRTDVY